MPQADTAQQSIVRRIACGVTRRLEAVIPLLGVLMFYGMLNSNDATAQRWQVPLVIDIATVHLGER